MNAIRRPMSYAFSRSSHTKTEKSFDVRRAVENSDIGSEELSSRRTSNMTSFMHELLSNEDESDYYSDNYSSSTRSRQARSDSKAASPYETGEKLDVLVLLGNERNMDKIETLTDNEYDMYNFRNCDLPQKISVIRPKIYYLNIDHEQVEREKKKFDYEIKHKNSKYVDPFDRDDDDESYRPRRWPRRSKSVQRRGFRCMSRANPKDNLKNIDRTKSISEHLKSVAQCEEDANQRSEALSSKRLSRQQLAKSAQRLSRQSRNSAEREYENEWNRKMARKLTREEVAKSAQRLSRRNRKAEGTASGERELKGSKTMDPDEMQRSVLRLSRLPKRTREEEKIKTVHDGKTLTDAEIEKISLRLYRSGRMFFLHFFEFNIY